VGRERALSKPATGDDAELLALKAKFDPLFATWVAMSAAERERHRLCVGLYERETGLKWDDRPAINWNDPAFVASDEAWQRASDMFDHAEDEDEDEDEREPWEKLLDKLNPLAAEILSYNASTLDGLRLQLRALISAYNETWEPAGTDDEDEEPEYPCMRNFIESAAGVLGVPFPPYGGNS
jgi:Phage related protein